ncbi:putative arm-like repeat-containing protein [Phaeoacremonium minimum UCRPA7]|uniref:Putative arm-like repeat-containing protein n=1 Tax=Phaeoacremonium minimum (strain UCR-PA7) TaxID=1286976 RepID=R8BX23_PHAM7|nr:putative arm-like repeat-containing protein [Phaeoacremonium minimum UCRPA7]EOO03941.1 putative arm-like repeat-containing protein [Phaeoacremonium minimum UCRPA7]
MGKSRRNRGARRADPIAKPVKPPSDPELAAIREKRILPVMKDLQSSEPKARTAAAGAIANIIQDTKCRKLLLREQVVHIVLTETLADSSIESRAAGWEILKTLAAEEDSDFCVHLYRLDILTAIAHACKTVVQALTAQSPPFAQTPKAQQRFVWDICSSVLSLVGALVVARDEIVDAIIKNEDIFRLLFTLVSYNSTPLEVFEETLTCLMALSEDNLQVSQLILADPSNSFKQLIKFKSASGSRAVLACGVLHNMFAALEWHDHSPGQDGATDAALIPALTRLLEQTKTETTTANGNASMTPIDVLQLALEILASIATDLQGSLEKGNKREEEWNGIGDDTEMNQDQEGEEDPEEDGEHGEHRTDDDVEMDEDEMEADMEMVTGADDHVDDVSGIDDIPTLRELIQKAIPQLIRLSNAPLSSDEALAIQMHSLSALNNIAWTVSCIDFADGENGNIFQVWAPAAKRIWSKVIAPILATDTADINLAAVVASLAWAIARSLQGSVPLSGDEHRKFMSLYQASKKLDQDKEAATPSESDPEDPFQGLGVKCIGVLGQLGRDPAPIPLNREIGIFLITVLSSLPEIPTAEAIEALNQLFDIYGDEKLECDREVFWKDNFLKHLEEISPKAKTMAKSIDKRAQGELRSRADEAVLNLNRFIQYKKKNKP